MTMGATAPTAPTLAVRLAGLAELHLEDHDRRRAQWAGPFTRPSTVAERVWLAGRYSEMPGRLSTRVELLRDGTRRRSWPTLAGRPQRDSTADTA